MNRIRILKRLRQVEERQVAQQDEINQLSQELNDAKTNIDNEITALEQQISEGKSGAELDLSGLKAAVGGITGITVPAAASTATDEAGNSTTS